VTAGFALDAALIALAFLFTQTPLPASTIERFYTNGAFAWLNTTFVPLANAVPFALGDLEVALAILVPLALAIVRLRRARTRRMRAVLTLAAHGAGYAAAIVLAFELLWALNYHRVPITARVDFDAARVDAPAVDAYAARIARILNADVASAHAHAHAQTTAQTRAELAAAFAPVVARLGDTWPVAVTVPKTTIADRVYAMAGVGGQYDPYAFETLLAATFLPFEWERALAHEWAHVAGFGNEGDANFIGTVTCLRASDPLLRYSAAFWTYGEFPADVRARHPISAAVVADYTASSARFNRFYNPKLFAFSWHLYDRYLRANGVQGGVVSYNDDLRLLVGTRFDADGLPLRAPRLGGRGERGREPARVLAEDRPERLRSERERFEATPIGVVREGHVGIVGAEHDVRRRRFDERPIGAGVERRAVRERHRRIEKQVRVRGHERDVARAIRHAEVRNDHAQPRVPREHARNARRAVVRVVLPRHRADVHEHEALALGEQGQHRVEARIVEREPLHVLVHLEPDAAVVERCAQVANRVGIVEVHGREREPVAADLARGRGEPGVELPRHPGLVRVGAEHEPLDPRRAQRRNDGRRLGRMLEHPRAAFGEPTPNGGKEPRRVEVHVHVDHRSVSPLTARSGTAAAD
jgi:hypothetical protein